MGGGPDGNERLTATTGIALVVLVAGIGITILRIRQLISEHLFLGLLLLGPVALKMASTGYRFVRYYTHNPAYRRKGPPPLVLRMIAPVLVLSTLVMLASGIVLLFEGPSHRGQWLLIHKVSFIVWLVFAALHVLGHLPELGRSLRVSSGEIASGGGVARSTNSRFGASERWMALTGAVVLGAVLAILLIPSFGSWTKPGAFPHHHHLRASSRPTAPAHLRTAAGSHPDPAAV